jgi:hypothetical protein
MAAMATTDIKIEMMAEKLENCKDWNKLEARRAP